LIGLNATARQTITNCLEGRRKTTTTARQVASRIESSLSTFAHSEVQGSHSFLTHVHTVKSLITVKERVELAGRGFPKTE